MPVEQCCVTRDCSVQVEQERCSRSFLYNGNVTGMFPLFFLYTVLELLTVIFNECPSVIKLIRLLTAVIYMFMCRIS